MLIQNHTLILILTIFNMYGYDFVLLENDNIWCQVTNDLDDINKFRNNKELHRKLENIDGTVIVVLQEKGLTKLGIKLT